MKARELGTLAIRLMAVFQLIAALNFTVTWIVTLYNGRQPGMAPSTGLPYNTDNIGGLVVVVIGVALMVLVAKFLWERAAALAYMCLVPFNPEDAASDTAGTMDWGTMDWPVLAFSCLGTWILINDIPQVMQLLLTLVLSTLVPGGPYGSMYTRIYLPSLLAAALRVLLGFCLLFRARQVAGWMTLIGEHRDQQPVRAPSLKE